MENPASPLEAVLKRRYPHPVARVFRAWSVPRHLESWLRPETECTLRVARFDFREGGEFVFHYTLGNETAPVHGKFLAIVPEQNLIYSWCPQPPDPWAGRETMVSVWFHPLAADETEIEIRHTLFPDEMMRDRHHSGWSAAFEFLAQHLQKTQ
ncbi:MAG TPA: SRPBCC domain-containing protein [Opitutaceae bacterium]|nr:SRPBCC domain-containing protein [Opitutaceae bacterium]